MSGVFGLENGRNTGYLGRSSTRWDRSITLMLLAIIVALAIYTYFSTIDIIKGNACYSNRQTVINALELYEMDGCHTCPDDYQSCIYSLIQGGYLTEAPACPDKGQYRLELDAESRLFIFCSQHPTQAISKRPP